jgi:hypothetical protein
VTPPYRIPAKVIHQSRMKVAIGYMNPIFPVRHRFKHCRWIRIAIYTLFIGFPCVLNVPSLGKPFGRTLLKIANLQVYIAPPFQRLEEG